MPESAGSRQDLASRLPKLEVVLDYDDMSQTVEFLGDHAALVVKKG